MLEVLTAIQRARTLGADENPAFQGLAHKQLGQLAEALQVYEEALALNPLASSGNGRSYCRNYHPPRFK
ncbi:tetratricopeptide repeat protein [Pseudomonas sp. E102]|uniref:tetratricopeptide repeat protein n=1 Tax=Pseudomonas sp. E102 TaxID=181579 RepID=UPI00404637BB